MAAAAPLRVVGAPAPARAVGRRVLRRQRLAAATDADVWPALVAATARPVFVFGDARRRHGQLYTPASAPFGGARAVVEGDAARTVDPRMDTEVVPLATGRAILVERRAGLGGPPRYARLSALPPPPAARRRRLRRRRSPPDPVGDRAVRRLLATLLVAMDARRAAALDRATVARVLDAYADA